MTINKAIISVEESNTLLADKADWVGLTDDEKTVFISRSSVYIQTTWTCEDVDWEDDSTISNIIKESCAYYAYADYKGNLFPELDASSTPIGRVTQDTKKLGTLEKTIKYSDSTASTAKYPLRYPDTLMKTECYKTGSNGLTRV